jgi:iron complex outermembrane receptor protein
VLAATSNLLLPVQNMSGTAYDPANVAAIIYTGYQNVARQHIKGVDASIAYVFSSGSNQFNIEANASYLESDQQLSAGQPVFEQAGNIFRPPHWRGTANASWKRGAATLAVGYNYLGGTNDNRATTIYKVKAFHSVDATIGWKPEGSGIWSGWSFLLASQNLLNRKPSLIRTTSVALPNYDATNYPAIGRTLSLTLSKAW